MKMKRLLLFAISFMALGLASCSDSQDSEAAALETAERWAVAYFGYNYHEAERLSTPESRRWLQFAASNTTQQMIDLVNEQPVEASADDLLETESDSMVQVRLVVNNYVQPALLGNDAERKDEGTFVVDLVRRNDGWLVKMACPPRSERQSRD